MEPNQPKGRGFQIIKKILVTGSSGTIGTRLCEKLLEKGYEVVGADWKPNKWNKKIEEITVSLDLRNKSELAKLPKDFDLVIHLAANARVYNLVKNPDLARDNFETTFNALDFARKNNIKRFIFASSRETYGNSGKTVCSEKQAYIQNCESPYTASKIAGEALVHSYQGCYGIDFVILRFSNVYGMYDESDRVIPLFIKLTKKGKDLTVFGKGKLLDFTYIDDAVSGILKAIDNFENAKNGVYNIAFGKGILISELAKLIQKSMAGKSSCENKLVIKSSRIGEVVKFVADISKAKKKLGYSPKINIVDGIEKTVKWYKKNLYSV